MMLGRRSAEGSVVPGQDWKRFEVRPGVEVCAIRCPVA
jgi:hypothetical protein